MDVSRRYKVEIWFRIVKDHSGYPESKTWEQLLAWPVLDADDYFQLESVPLFLKSVSRGDIVQAKTVVNLEISPNEVFEFVRVIQRGGHNTYRILLRQHHEDDPDFTIQELIGKGLAVERGSGDLLALDVPPDISQAQIDQYLLAQTKIGRWEMQDGHIEMRT